MKYLLTNDDGIEAPGLAALERAVDGLGTTTVVAPREHLSGCSHQVSTDRALRLTEVAPGRHAVDGMPADCTRLGLLHVSPDVEWVFAGINDGGNLGVDVHMSGTVAAVREAALLGKPAIAFSQFRRGRYDGEPSDGAIWTNAAALARRVLDALREEPLEPGAFWNVNFPDPADRNGEPELVFCSLDASHLHLHYEVQQNSFRYRGNYQQRTRQPGSDVDVCFSGRIAVTQVCPGHSWTVSQSAATDVAHREGH